MIDTVLIPAGFTLDDGPTLDIIETAQAAGSFQTLVQAVIAAGLVDTLQGDGPFTVFAPDDEAFGKLDPELLQALLDKPEKLSEILTYHVVAGQVLAADIVPGEDVATVNGQTFQITLDSEGTPIIGDTAITQTDIQATNGVIHVIDTVLIPEGFTLDDGPTLDIVETAQAAGSFQTLVQAVIAAGLVDTLQGDGPFTVFAPDDEAFGKLDPELLQALLDKPEKLSEILTYHVVAGQVLAADIVPGEDVATVNGQTFQITLDSEGNPIIGDTAITQTDIQATNGVIHVIDTVLIPEGFTLDDGPTLDIIETAQAAGSFQTLVQAVIAAGLVDTLQGDGPFTVFAPDDEAFGKLDPELLQALLDKPEKLAEILTYHVVAGQVLAADIVPGEDVATVNGQTFQITLDSEDNPIIGDTAITQTDIQATNGVIHVIDTVLIPEGFTLDDGPTLDIIETAQAAGSFQTLVQAVIAAGLVDTLQGEGPFTVFAPG